MDIFIESKRGGIKAQRSPIPVPVRILLVIGLDHQPYGCLFSATAGSLKPNDQ